MSDEPNTEPHDPAPNTDPLYVDRLPPEDQRVDPNTGKPRYIRMDRFEEVYGELKNAEKLIASTDVRGLRQQITDLEGQVAGHQEERALWGVGITDPEAQDVARYLYGRVPEADRPEGGVAGWVSGFKDAPDTAPVALRGYPRVEPLPGSGGTSQVEQRHRAVTSTDRRAVHRAADSRDASEGAADRRLVRVGGGSAVHSRSPSRALSSTEI